MALNSSTLNSDTTIEAKGVEKQPQPINPRLCSRCQVWDDVWSWPYERYAYVSLEELSQNSHCIICQAVATVGDTRRRESDSLQHLPPSRILLRSNGPYFLDRGPGWGNPEPYRKAAHRIHSTDATKLAIKLLIHLDIIIHNPDSGLPDDLSTATPTLVVTPQFCLWYSTVEELPHLISIEPWEVDFFDVSLLKTWIKGCEKAHGQECFEHDYPCELVTRYTIICRKGMMLIFYVQPPNCLRASESLMFIQ